jgi:high affinity Mn2+ porin
MWFRGIAFCVLLSVGLGAAARAQDAPPPAPADRPEAPPSRFDWGFQATVITQTAPSFRSAYEGPRSFANEGSARWSTTITTTTYTGLTLWRGAWASVQPEYSGGGGPGGGQGIAAYVNQDAVKAGSSVAQHPYIARAFIHQDIPLGSATAAPSTGEEEGGRDLDAFVADSNSRFESGAPERVEFTIGKFSLADFFDPNDVAGDVHHRLMNWALVNNGAWDYAADARGYTWGVVVAVFEGPFALRLAASAMPTQANGIHFDTALADAHGVNAELTWTFDPAHKGAVRALAWLNHARMGSYEEALASASASPRPPDITESRRPGRTKRGYGLNAQRTFGDWGTFLRAGWSDGRNESFAYTEIDRTASAGLSHDAGFLGRKDDVLVAGFVTNGLSSPHRRYLEAGGIGFQIGDGRLTYGHEEVLEGHYNAQITSGVSLAADFQHVWNPGYNRDRGPINVFGLRVHLHP